MEMGRGVLYAKRQDQKDEILKRQKSQVAPNPWLFTTSSVSRRRLRQLPYWVRRSQTQILLVPMGHIDV